jgi:hypothetical protein
MRHTDRRHSECSMRASVSGSFHRHMDAITSAVHQLASLCIHVLSPADPRVVAQQGEFLFVASDRVRSVRLVQDRHLESIRAADFLWLVCPDGYVGSSASMEVGYAAAVGVPIFGAHAPTDLTLREYVSVVPKLSEAVRKVEASDRPRLPGGILIDPHASAEEAHGILERIETALLTSQTASSEPVHRVYREVVDLQRRLGLPTCVQ